MNNKEFISLKVNIEDRSARMPIKAENCTSAGFLYGGAGLAVSIEAMEAITGRPCAWATTQFSSFARPPDEVQIEIKTSGEGNNISHADMSANVGEKVVFNAMGSFGSREIKHKTQWATMPVLDLPENCPVFGGGKLTKDIDCIDKRIEFRVARGSLRKDKPSDEQMATWVKIAELGDINAGSLALMADYLTVGAGSMLKRPAGGNSLDNSLRIMQLVPTEWVLCDCDVRGIQNGLGHATMNMWSQDGVLLAIASQSFIFRTFDFKKGAKKK